MYIRRKKILYTSNGGGPNDSLAPRLSGLGWAMAPWSPPPGYATVPAIITIQLLIILIQTYKYGDLNSSFRYDNHWSNINSKIVWHS